MKQLQALSTVTLVPALIGAILLVFGFAAVYRWQLGYEPPLGEVTIATLGTLAGAQRLMSSYSDYQVRKTEIQFGGQQGGGPAPP